VENDVNRHAVVNKKPAISRFEFKGTGSEYFGIWIVNILLTIVTLGIFSAWAKVRNKQYFYGNTYLEGSSFEYTALPMQILKGRIIAVVFFVLYNLASSYLPTVGIVLGLLLFILAPWVIMKSLAFNARYSQYRNIRFGFHQDLKESVKVFVLIPLLAFMPMILIGIFIAVLGGGSPAGAGNGGPGLYFAALIPLATLLVFAVYPYLIYRTKRYVADNHRYGNADFNLRLDSAKPFYKIYLKVALILVAAAICIFILAKILGLTDMVENLQNTEISSLHTSQRYIQNVDLKSSELENLDLENLDLENLDLENLDLENFDLQNVDPSNTGNAETDIRNQPIPPELGIGFFIMQIISLLLYLFIFAYIAAHTYNLIYQNTDVGKHRLRANMKPSGLAMIYFTNTLGIIFTLGLFIPWAKVRTARYRATHTALQVNGDLDSFVAKQDEQQNVFGEEFGEVFDLDVGI